MRNCVVLFVLSIPALFGGWNVESAIAQTVVESAECFAAVEGESLHTRWLEADMQGRLDIVEQIGEDGAERVCQEKGWSKVLGKESKTSAHRQGFDQVWKSVDGRVHVIEAKGGASTVDYGYGFRQGTPEWAVKAAEKTLGNHAATEVEKEAARAVLNAASEGRLSVHVIRTSHYLGKPTQTVWESMTKCTPEAERLACSTLESLRGYSTELSVPKYAETAPKTTTWDYSGASSSGTMYESGSSYKTSASYESPSSWKGSSSGSGAAKSAVKSTTKAASKTTEAVSQTGQIVRTVAEGAAVVGVAADVGFRGYEAYQTEKSYQNGRISNHERVKSHVQNGAGFAGGMGGAMAGGYSGAAVGAAIGSIVPGPGTAIGGFVGGVCGAIGGYFAGDKAASYGAGAAVDAFHR